ncbi:acetyltransferase [Streptomyces sp. NPDC048644]|uniref:acetyltransferase n=1 Tax=Streptomyces sp. NPDC048644 TaxID=3365582 RepID=UPI00372317E1
MAGTGEAARIHEALPDGRPEDRATLLVDATHGAVQRRYEEWGYRCIGDQQPFADAPVYSMLVRDLPG